ncbi:MAG TPA: hypothetical protein VMW54_01100 [Terriglobia bacterium]|nr:hypothetical protein [Terriglobia bacterium]
MTGASPKCDSPFQLISPEDGPQVGPSLAIHRGTAVSYITDNEPQRWTAARVAKAVRAKATRPAKGCKRSWKCYCPAHADKNPSLWVSEKPSGQILIHCFAGCPVEAVLDVLNLSKSDLFPDRTASQKVVFRYSYYDESYHLLYEKVRLSPKGFYCQKPDGRGGWTRNLEGIRQVLYRLPEVLRARRVIICEGEKDCRTLRKLEKFLGLPYIATTSGGAETWRPEFAEWLTGKDVVVIPDKDLAGKKFRRKVVHSLRDRARSLKVITLPVRKDVTAWLEAGDGQDMEGAVEQLEQFILEAPELRRRRAGDYEKAILAFLDRRGETLKDIRDRVKGKTRDVDKALRNLLARGEVQRSGAGVRNSPFLYSLPHSSFPRHTHSLRNVLPTSECDSNKTRMNSEPILVPNLSSAEFLNVENEIGKHT